MHQKMTCKISALLPDPKPKQLALQRDIKHPSVERNKFKEPTSNYYLYFSSNQNIKCSLKMSTFN